MKKKLLATILSAAMVLGLTACGGSTEQAAAPAADTATEATTEEAAPAAEAVDYGTGEIKIWAPEATVDFTTEKVTEFFAANPDMAGYTFTVEPVGEGDAAGNMITDVIGGADLYNFAQDQIARLVSAGALSPVMGDNATFVSTNNDAGAVGAATVGDTIYAYPLTSDNGYFLYYDKSVVTDPTSLEKVVADCEAAGKNFYMEINSGWYQTAFFFATGCELTFDTDSDGNFTGANVNYDSDAGVVALKEMIELASSRMRVFITMIMPMSKPIIIYTALVAFMAPWCDYVFASYVAFGHSDSYNVAVALQRWVWTNDYQGYFTRFCAGGILIAVPVTILFMCLQKYYVEGVTGGAVKG